MEVTSVSISGKRLVYQCHLNLKDEQSAELVIDGNLKLTITFHSGQNPDAPGTRLAWTADSGTIQIHAYGWTNTLGESLVDPLTIGKNTSTNKEISFMLLSQRIGTFNSCHFDILEG